MGIRGYLAGALGVALVSGCGNTIPAAYHTYAVQPQHEYKVDSSYLYGRFFMEKDSSEPMGFSIRCRDGKWYKFWFSHDRPLMMFKLRPSVCQIEEYIFAGLDKHRTMATARLIGNAYDRTTAEMKRAWPRFASVRTEDRVPR